MSGRLRKFGAPLFACAVGLTVLVASWGSPVKSAVGCNLPRFGGDSATFGAGTGPRSVAAADFNLDGRHDLAVANYGSGQGSANGSISILLNNGSGGFTAAGNISAGINPRSIVTADFNNDTKPDLAVVNYISGSCCIAGFATVLLGDGAGNFSPSGPPLSVGNDPSSLAVGDFNKDGKPDLAATILSSPSGSVAVLLGDGMGRFGTATTFSSGGNAAIATGDVNGDGKPDLVTANLNGLNVFVLIGDGAGAFAAPVAVDTAGFPQFVALGDFNQDTKLDIVTANTSNFVSVLLGNGDGSFGAATTFAVASSPRSVFVQDLNGDGRLDLVTANSGTNNASILFGNGSGPAATTNTTASGRCCGVWRKTRPSRNRNPPRAVLMPLVTCDAIPTILRTLTTRLRTLPKLNQFNGNVQNADIVKAFIS